MTALRIGISLGDDTEEFLQDLLSDLDDDALDQLLIDRELESSVGLAGEPITIGAIIAGSTAILSVILRLIERKLEHDHQYRVMRIVSEGHSKNPDLGHLLSNIAVKYTDVSVKNGIAKTAWMDN